MIYFVKQTPGVNGVSYARFDRDRALPGRLGTGGMVNDAGADRPAEAFGYRSHKDGTVRIAWRGRVVTTLAGNEAARFLARIEGATADEAQLAMAKATGNFKRGNERTGGRP